VILTWARGDYNLNCIGFLASSPGIGHGLSDCSRVRVLALSRSRASVHQIKFAIVLEMVAKKVSTYVAIQRADSIIRQEFVRKIKLSKQSFSFASFRFHKPCH
jgi:hypothetical protein